MADLVGLMNDAFSHYHSYLYISAGIIIFLVENTLMLVFSIPVPVGLEKTIVDPLNGSLTNPFSVFSFTIYHLVTQMKPFVTKPKTIFKLTADSGFLVVS